jgi:predicted phage terminase large subunit-like protein
MKAKLSKEIQDIRRHWEAHQTEMHRWCTLPADDSPLARSERITRARKDYVFFVNTYFPHLAKKPCGKFQIDAAKYILKNSQSRCVFEWARGHAKSTHMSLLIPLFLKIQENRDPIVMILVSKSQDAAVRLLSDLQGELQFNTLFIADFGEQVAGGSWEAGEFKTTDNSMFIALGRGQSPRGIKNRGVRVNYIVIDDIDDDEICRNLKRVRYATEWCLSALIGTMDMGRGRFILVGNRISQTSVLTSIAERPNFYHTTVNAVTKNGVPNWSENYTIADIAKLRTEMGERMFQKEYMNNPINEGSVFEKKYIRYEKMLPLREYVALVCYTDPSFKDGTKNDFKASVLVGMTKKGEYHIIKCYADQTSVTKMIQWHYDIKHFCGDNPVLFYMESNFIQDLIMDEFRNAGEAVGYQIPIRGDGRKKPDKFARIEALQPLFERGFVIFSDKEKNSLGMMQLEEQLLMFEKGSKTHDDAPDALEGAIFLLNQRHRIVNSAYIGGQIRGGSRQW